jgi:hypothetical protein
MYADEYNQCFPGVESIAEILGVHPKSVRRSLASLETHGFISRERRVDGKGMTISTRYTLLEPTPRACLDKKSGGGQTGGTKSAGQGGQKVLLPPGQKVQGNKTYKEQDPINKTGTRRPRVAEPEDLDLARWMFSLNEQLLPGSKEPKFEDWANDIRLMRERDQRTPEAIRELYQWAHDDGFWKSNIRCPEKLREKWETLAIQKGSNRNGNGKPHYKPGPGQLHPVDAAAELF